jgi:hypothetical protein
MGKMLKFEPGRPGLQQNTREFRVQAALWYRLQVLRNVAGRLPEFDRQSELAFVIC